MRRIFNWIIIIFALFLFSVLLYSLLSAYVNAEIPFIKLTEFGSSFFDKPSPANHIKEYQILIYDDRIVILIPNAIISSYANTKSMDPVIDYTANGIEIVPQSPEQIHVGDIIAFTPNSNSNELIVHRVIEIGVDEQGWYCITKGDNAMQDDGIKVRWEQVKLLTIAILY